MSDVVLAQTVTWSGGNMTWTQPDSDSWSSATYNSGNTAVFDGSGTGTVTIDAGGVTPGQVNVTSGSYTFSGGGIGGSGGIAKSGAGTLTLTAANTYAGTTSITAGVLNIRNATALGSTAAGTTVSSGAALELQGNITVTGESLSINGSGVASTGALRNMSGSNTWTGSISADLLGTVDIGNRVGGLNRLQSDTTSHLLLSGPVSIAVGTFNGTAGTSAALILQGNGTGEISGNITGGVAGAMTVARGSGGTGAWKLSGSNTYLGYTAINSNELIVAGGAAIPDTSLVYFLNAGKLTLEASETIGSLTSDATTASINLNSRTLTIGADNSTPVAPGGATTYLGGIIGTGGIVKVGAGTLTLSGTNTYTGGTQINGGVLALGSAAAIGSSGTISFGGGTLRFSASNTTDYSSRFSTAGGQAYSLDTNGQNVTLASALTSSGGSLTKQGAGTLTLSGGAANTFSGLTSVTGGQLNLAKNTGNAVGGDLSISGALVTFAGNNQIADTAAVTMSGSSAVFNGTGYQAGGNFSLQDSFASLTVTGGIVNAGSNNGTGITVTGAGSFTGGAGDTEYVLSSGGHGSFGSLALVGMTGSTAPANPAPNTFRLAGNDTVRQTQVTIGSGGLSLDGSNILVSLGGNSPSPALGSQIVLNGDVTTLGSTASSIMAPTSGDGAFGSRAVALSGTAGSVTRSFTIGGGGANLTVSIPITNGLATTAGIRKLGGGILTLGTASTYTGATTINAGTLALGLNGSFANSPVITIGDAGSSGAVLDISAKTGTFTFAASQTVGGIGTLKVGAGNTAAFAGIFAPGNSAGLFTLDGGTTLLSGTTQIEILGSARGTGYDAVDLINSAVLNYSSGSLLLDFGSSLAAAQSYQLFGDGAQSILGTLFSLTLSGNNYTGLTFNKDVGTGVWTSTGSSPSNQTLAFTEATGTLVIVPEPAVGVLAAIAAAATAWAARRINPRRQPASIWPGC
jgi:autotransporter-associated beta strand protein